MKRMDRDFALPWSSLADVLVGSGLVLVAALGLSHLLLEVPDPLQAALAGQGGGLAGWLFGTLPQSLLGDLITTLLLLVLAGLGLWLAARPLGLPSIDWGHVGREIRALPRRLMPDSPEQAAGRSPSSSQEVDPPSIAAPAPMQPPTRPKRRRSSKTQPATPPVVRSTRKGLSPTPRPEHLPPLDILGGEKDLPQQEADIEYKKQVIEYTLASFNVPVEVVDVNVGPTVTQFGVKPGTLPRRGPTGETVQRRVRVSRIQSLANDLALALEAPTLRIEAPVPGKGYVGIEVPNSATSLVGLRAVLESREFAQLNAPLAFAVGRDVSGQPVAADLATMPHLLIAGATGSGKSVFINSLVASLLFNNDPDTLRLLLVDPKRVELAVYEGVPHLAAPVVHDPDQVAGALTWLLVQMDERYRAFSRLGVRNLDSYNAKLNRKRVPAEWRDLEPFPHMVLVIDELADLMVAQGDVIEHHLCRLAQMARATGIHLVVATQRPSVDVVTGLIKANFPSRIAFAVTSQTDSRVILDVPGADKLLGRGDMLFMRPDTSKLARIQGCFVSDKELAALVSFWQEATPAPELPPNVPRFPWTGLMAQIEDHDEMYERALDLLRDQERISTSWLQRRLRVGYNKAAELIARMELDGYVGPDEGAGRGREVLLAQEDDEEDMEWSS
jgi:S-DNA-T family DNA segregation ATPase FtsK/SpoIIIE